MATDPIKYTELTFQLIVESSPNAIILVNKEGKIAYINSQTEKLFGYGRAELIGQTVEQLIPQRFSGHHPRFRDMFFKAPAVRSMGAGRELFASRKNGTEFPIEIGLNPVVTADGTLVLASIIDITERKLQEITLKKQVELETKNKELEQFAYVASHDLQEPLRTVSNYMQVIEEDYSNRILDSQALKYIHSVNNATSRMSMLIKALLDFSRLGNNRKLVNTDCNGLVKEVLADLQTVIKTSHAKIHVAHLPVINIYETEMRQLFQNLITNAVKFCRKGTKPEVWIVAQEMDGKWQFSIRDNGIGIERAHFTRIFEIFQRLHTAEEYEGNGIGLANCKKIVELHQGEMSLESIPGEGSIFMFTIPPLVI